ncbi:MAG: flagellar hook-length control protein FliK [Zoogloeaceae bacterium]|jgi:hypothetical protein|nr:flagellar hook-length control protein FliK [Zoogloeaceae bacterium]
MIPADVADTAARVRQISDLSTRPTPPAQKLADALSDFVPGQRLMATIQALLPNGTYRAMIAQRDITLALPFAAKPGDALELEVVDTNGKLALAVVAGGGKATAGAENASVATRLTAAGRLIGDLLAGLDRENGKRPQPAPLNNTQPVLNRSPEGGADLAPALKMALARSGMFYESHQARWVDGKLGLQTLLQEPQGRLSPAAHALARGMSPELAGRAAGAMAQPANVASANPASANVASANPAPANAATAQTANAAAATASSAATMASAASAADAGAVRVGMNQLIAPNLAALVQQQLEALATHCYTWQGQVWPGQDMEWEIVEEDADNQEKRENTAANWTTRLNLTLPGLGGIAATLRLSGGKEIEIMLRADNEDARKRLSAGNAPLRQQFETAGLKLAAFSVSRHARDEFIAGSGF